MIDEAMTPAEYIEKRLEDQISWYNRKSISYQSKYKRLRKAELIGAALLPLLGGLAISVPNLLGGSANPAALNAGTIITMVVALLGASIAIIAGLLGLGRYQEQWLEYRSTCEGLKREKILFQARVAPYDANEPFHLLVQRAETLMSSENIKWMQSLTPKGGEKDLPTR
jgi:Protein of unknown function (DUF4231)